MERTRSCVISRRRRDDELIMHGLSGWKEDGIFEMDMAVQIFLQLAEPCEERAIGIASVRRR